MSEGVCDFSIDGDCGDPADVFRESVVTARVRHKCYECDGSIEVGERYERISMRYDRRWIVNRLCPACSEISREFFDGGRIIGVLWDEMEVNWDDGAHLQACLNRLSTAASKQHMRRRWLAWKGLERL